jgi:recombinational DNA repair protein (RecF pathway)
MAYHIYHTEALILGGRPSGEGDRNLFCYTRELGLVMAHAKSLREGRSRLRYALQTFAHAEVDLIRGKHGWRLISARPVDSLGELWRHPSKRRILAHHTQLLERLIQGEEQNGTLFDDLLLGLKFLRDIEEESMLRSAELLLVIRLLAELGYWGDKTLHAPLFSENALTVPVLEYTHSYRPSLLVSVNEALRASQL